MVSSYANHPSWCTCKKCNELKQKENNEFISFLERVHEEAKAWPESKRTLFDNFGDVYK